MASAGAWTYPATHSRDGAVLRARMDYRVTVRYGKKIRGYLTLAVEAPDAPAAWREVADRIPPRLAAEVELVELRTAPGPARWAATRPPQPFSC